MFILISILLFIPLSAQGEIFQWTDANGKKHFSDRPHRGAEILHIHSGYSYFQVKKVFDGDTILLNNNKKVRLLGINTPEVEGRNKSVEAGGEEAKQWLIDQLLYKKIRLEKDVEKTDKYGRSLAFVFNEEKQNINLELVKKGFASVNIYPPNLKYTKSLLEAQQQAESDGLGIWKYKEYAPKQASEIKNTRFKGWQRVTGKISKINCRRKNCYLNFNNTFVLKIKQKTLSLFPDLNSYLGKTVEARGWISKRKNSYSMFIRHPSSIRLIIYPSDY